MSKITIYKTKEEQVEIAPCIKCGCDKISFVNHGYSSFNVASAECTNCYRKIVFNNVSWDAHDADIALMWNRENDASLLKISYLRKIKEYRALIDDLQNKIADTEKLLNNIS